MTNFFLELENYWSPFPSKTGHHSEAVCMQCRSIWFIPVVIGADKTALLLSGFCRKCAFSGEIEFTSPDISQLQ